MTDRGTPPPRGAADIAPPSDPPVVRRATADDLGTIVVLRLALLREYPDHPVYGRLRPDVEVRARALFAAQLESDHEVMFIAELKGAPVGLVRCVETVSSPLLLPERYCYLSSAFVKPEYRRRGVLQALLERAREWCDERGLVEIRLHNVGTRESAAGAWDALGFEVVEQVRLLRLQSSSASSHPTDSVRASARRESSAESATR
jgi:ribosomal protein S18 acetylase RimI-like enzyme